MKIEFADDEVETILAALDSYALQYRSEWLKTRDDADLEVMRSAEWCWQKIETERRAQFNENNSCGGCAGCPSTSVTNNETTASVDPYGMPAQETK
jgi:hypothetical protein